MCQWHRPGLSLRDLPEGGTIKVKQFAHAALGAPNFAVYLVGGHIDKTRRDFGQERPKSQALFGFFWLV